MLLREALADEGLEVLGEEDLTDGEREWLAEHFREQILPVLTPQAIDPSHPFPFIPNGGFSLIFDLAPGQGGGTGGRAADDPADLAALPEAARAEIPLSSPLKP